VTATRIKPNAFNNLHQIERKMKLSGSTTESTISAMTAQAMLQEFGLTHAEADATLNLALYVPAAPKKALTKAACTWGMWRGPFSHAFLACPALRLGYMALLEDDWWASKMKNVESTVGMIVQRCLDDWEGQPSGIRKTGGNDLCLLLQKICRVFELYMELLQDALPPAAFLEESGPLEHAFLLGCFDEQFKNDADDQPRPLDIKTVPEFAAVIKRQEHLLRNREVDKRNELTQQVQNATLTSLMHDANTDLANIQVYDLKLKEARDQWGPALLSYKRSRRNRGLTRATALMSTRLSCTSLDKTTSYADIPRTYAAFKSRSAVDMPCSTELLSQAYYSNKNN
jgi:hypothetical protein